MSQKRRAEIHKRRDPELDGNQFGTFHTTRRHSREGGNPCVWNEGCMDRTWFPAFAGMTVWVGVNGYEILNFANGTWGPG